LSFVCGLAVAAARSMISKGHCSTGKFTHVPLSREPKGNRDGRAADPGQVLSDKSKINVVVCRGRRRLRTRRRKRLHRARERSTLLARPIGVAASAGGRG